MYTSLLLTNFKVTDTFIPESLGLESVNLQSFIAYVKPLGTGSLYSRKRKRLTGTREMVQAQGLKFTQVQSPGPMEKESQACAYKPSTEKEQVIPASFWPGSLVDLINTR